jgi:peptidoglycan/xylan/chitin deacetylase (PgdA/CDA1 family)
MLNQLLAVVLSAGMLSLQDVRLTCVPPSNSVELPILLYHHVAPTDNPSALTVSPQAFEQQMQALVDLGFQAITPRQLSEALCCGLPLPERAVVITFDDGHADNFSYAFPVMRKHGLPGAMYVVANRTASPGFLTLEQLGEMVDAGWEIGSHTMSHPDLVSLGPEEMRSELYDSRLFLEDSLGITIDSLAYPYGSFSPEMVQKVRGYGYSNAMGLGTLTSHSKGTLYYLGRRAVDGQADLDAFLALLNLGDQWVSDRVDLSNPSSWQHNHGVIPL